MRFSGTIIRSGSVVNSREFAEFGDTCGSPDAARAQCPNSGARKEAVSVGARATPHLRKPEEKLINFI